MEGYLRFLQNLTATPPLKLQPCYAIDGDTRLDEVVIKHLPGYRDMGPVRIGNAAHAQVQLDVYGAAILAATQSFFDERLVRPGTQALFEALESLGEQSVAIFGTPDAGIWEYRGHTAVHTFSSTVCWAAADRLARIAGAPGTDRASALLAHARHMPCRDDCSMRPGRSSLDSFTTTFHGDSVDASLLLLAEMGVIDWTDPKFVSDGRERIGATLRRGAFLARYVEPDDFGFPQVGLQCLHFLVHQCALGHRVTPAGARAVRRDAPLPQRARTDVGGSVAARR